MTMTNLTARTTAHAQAAEVAMAFVPPSALNALKDAQGLQDAHDDLKTQLDSAHATLDKQVVQLAELADQLGAEKEAHAATQAALEAATKTPE